MPVRTDYTSLSPAKKCQFSSFKRSGLSAMSGLYQYYIAHLSADGQEIKFP